MFTGALLFFCITAFILLLIIFWHLRKVTSASILAEIENENPLIRLKQLDAKMRKLKPVLQSVPKPVFFVYNKVDNVTEIASGFTEEQCVCIEIEQLMDDFKAGKISVEDYCDQLEPLYVLFKTLHVTM